MRYLVIILSLYYLMTPFIREKAPSELDTYDGTTVDAIAYGPPNYQLYEYMKEYASIYDIPFDYALKCAREETGYRGKFHYTYTPFIDKLRRSYADAYGPLQVQVPTANDMWQDRNISADDLGYNIELNVITSFRYKRYLYEILNDWTQVYSVYNQGWKGKNRINEYAVRITGDADS